MDITTITGAYQGLKAAKELLTVAFDAKVDAESKPKILEAQTRLGEVQDALFMLRERLSELQDERNSLRQQLEASEAWKGKIDKYELTTTAGGAVVYAFKSTPPHYICPSCINKKEIHPLQNNRTLTGKYRCTGCSSEYPIEERQRMEPLPTQGSW
jgi:predicted RNA-binding Zn-ribbon protein involved in translation (DUF1610 family)